MLMQQDATEAMKKTLNIGDRRCMGKAHNATLSLVSMAMVLSGMGIFEFDKSEDHLDPENFKAAVEGIKAKEGDNLLFFQPLSMEFKGKVLLNKDVPGFINSGYDEIFTPDGTINLEEYAKGIIAPYFLVVSKFEIKEESLT